MIRAIRKRDENSGAVIPATSGLEGEPDYFADSGAATSTARRKAKWSGGGYNPRSTANAQKLRKEMTNWEYRLWQELRGKKLGGHKFRRQQPIGNFIVDFVNVEKKIIIELDGSQHLNSEDDKKRDAYLMERGYSLLRFWNTAVNANMEGVLTAILSVLEAPPHQTTSHRPSVARISDSAWEVVWLPLKGGAPRGEAVPCTSKASASRFAVNSEELIEHKHATACSPLEGEPNRACDLVGGNA